MDKRILYYIWISNVLKPGTKSIKQLFEYFGSIEKIYEADKNLYKDAGIKQSEISALGMKDLSLAETQYNYCKREKIGFLCYDDPYYPERLKLIDDPPAMFYYRGRLALLDDYPCVAMVGTRNCTPDGYRLAYRLAYTAAANGIVPVNGLAAGIDGACIAAALDANAYAVGVLGCGIDRIYPTSNRQLFYRLSASGLILTEFPPFTEPKGTNFPVRNRVISGISLASAIFEADAERSGAMITARHALNQGRHIFAVPGNPDDKKYSGALELIKDGADVLTDADDLISEYSMMFPHRINTRRKVTVPTNLLEGYVKEYFVNGKAPKKSDYSDTKRAYSKNKAFEQNNASADSFGKSENSSFKTNSGEFDSQTHNTAINNDVKVQKSHLQSEEYSQSIPEQPKIQSKEQSISANSGKDLSLLSSIERQIYELFEKNNTMSADDIVSFGIKIEDVLSSLTLLEVYGLIEAIPGGRFKFID